MDGSYHEGVYREKDSKAGSFSGVGFIMVGLVIIGLNWYHAGMQQDLWDREGVHLTKWEIFMGVKPTMRMTP